VTLPLALANQALEESFLAMVILTITPGAMALKSRVKSLPIGVARWPRPRPMVILVRVGPFCGVTRVYRFVLDCWLIGRLIHLRRCNGQRYPRRSFNHCDSKRCGKEPLVAVVTRAFFGWPLQFPVADLVSLMIDHI